MDDSSEKTSRSERSFYWLREPQSGAYGHSGVREWKPEQLRRFALGIDRPGAPIRIEWGQGRKVPSDIIWLTVSSFAVSPRCLDVLSGFSGWSTFPVEVVDGYGRLVPGYEGLVITGRSGRARNNLCRVETQERWGFKEYVGLIIDLDSWDGSDFFCPLKGPGPFVTAKVRDAFRKAKIGNCNLVLSTDVRMAKEMVDRFLADVKRE